MKPDGSCQRTMTTAELARLWRVGRDKVLGWIRRGELKAFNVATDPLGPPKYRIPIDALENFKAERAPMLARPARSPRRRKAIPRESIPQYV